MHRIDGATVDIKVTEGLQSYPEVIVSHRKIGLPNCGNNIPIFKVGTLNFLAT